LAPSSISPGATTTTAYAPCSTTRSRATTRISATKTPALAFLGRVAESQAALVAQWLAVGFIHGVLNTDNMTISGETIDYGPCAFMDRYDPRTVYSSIDRHGRYAFGNQSAIAQWNLARLAETLLPLIDADPRRAVELATACVQAFTEDFAARFLRLMAAKLGFATVRDGDDVLINELLTAMHHGRADYTNTVRALTEAAPPQEREADFLAQFDEPTAAGVWLAHWLERLDYEGRPPQDVRDTLRAINPAFIPRNHRVETALHAATESGDLAPFRRLLSVLQRPFDDHPGVAELTLPPGDDERVLATFCGT
jgi:uncharacterized protein YdiU (UPF0061 family)